MTAHVLIVDDTPSVRNLVRKLLDKLSVSVTEAEDGQDGLAKFKSLKGSGQTVKLIISDYNMPNMNGIEFITEVRKSDKTTPIIMLTTMRGDDKKLEGKQAGANGWITKPFSPEPFLKAIKQVSGL